MTATCQECGGDLKLTTGYGRTHEHGNTIYLLPNDVELLTCQDCGEWAEAKHEEPTNE